MASQFENLDLDLAEQVTSIKRDIAEIDQRNQQMRYEPYRLVFTGMATGAGLLALAIAILQFIME
ncbi:hypothetical protein [Alterisphingorhabdus coralli]|uniref:Uncharacterized protein n=1 Tax=Alterisphingorhabdus coralli TaxID=3071408 RepID=A0AA97I3E3_9SPHN|nr:hypothetical protein [Parasphingorhabdus sp. SCSIO 66989]WOE76715.1 hypothetical protein RB602_15125 [Parasphingorhabdus sp. SCSIO 66989]